MPPLCTHWMSRAAVRGISTSSIRNTRFRYSNPSTLKEIGRLLPVNAELPYDVGQVFIHRTFAYRGVIVCGFKSRFSEKKAGSTEKESSLQDYYQVLIHRNDWPTMMFPVDMTSYLQDGPSSGEKLLTMINGMDCVSNADVIPYVSTEQGPVDHDLFDRIFDKTENERGELAMHLKPKLVENYWASQKSWLAPRDVYREVTENIEVTVTTFYLGSTVANGQHRHVWRYVIRLENHAPHITAILRERSIKIYSLNNMNKMQGQGVYGKQPELSMASPAFQYSSTIELPHSKGGHMWGRFKMERDNGSVFEVTIPTIALESFEEKPLETAEKISE